MKVMMKVVIPFHFIQKSSNENLYARGSTQNKNEKMDELLVITYIKGLSWR